MALDLKKIRAVANEAAKTGPDVNKQQAGGDFSPPDAGPTRLRFIEYVEVGVHTKKSALYGDKTKPMAQFGFELSGPKHKPKVIDGKTYPFIIRFEEPIGFGSKNNYSKLFKLMAAAYPGVVNFPQMLGEAFRSRVSHRTYKVGDQERVAAEIKTKDAGYSIAGPTFEDEDTGETKVAMADPVISPFRLLVWNEADTDQWDSLYIGGTYDDGGSKNKVQNKIRTAENFVGSPIYDALIAAGREAEVEVDAAVAPEQQEAEEPEADAPPVKAPVKEAVKKAPAKAVAPSKSAAKATPAPAKKTAQKPAKAVEPEDDGDPLQGL